MIIERETSHEALHIAGAKTVRTLGRNRYHVAPPIDVADLPAAEEEARRRRGEREAEPTLEERLETIEARLDALENPNGGNNSRA